MPERTKKRRVSFLFVNGLNMGLYMPQDRLAHWWWKRKGIELHHAHINWFDNQNIDDKVAQVVNQVQHLLANSRGVALIGTSAGGSLVLNAFHQLNRSDVCVITLHARLKVGNYTDQQHASLFHRAYLHTKHPSLVFRDSVTRAETETIPALSADERKRILTMSSLSDLVVPPSLMHIENVQNHRSLTATHVGGYFAHLLTNRDRIIAFAEQSL